MANHDKLSADGMTWYVTQAFYGKQKVIAAFFIQSDAELFAYTLREYGNDVEIVAAEKAVA